MKYKIPIQGWNKRERERERKRQRETEREKNSLYKNLAKI